MFLTTSATSRFPPRLCTAYMLIYFPSARYEYIIMEIQIYEKASNLHNFTVPFSRIGFLTHVCAWMYIICTTLCLCFNSTCVLFCAYNKSIYRAWSISNNARFTLCSVKRYAISLARILFAHKSIMLLWWGAQKQYSHMCAHVILHICRRSWTASQDYSAFNCVVHTVLDAAEVKEYKFIKSSSVESILLRDLDYKNVEIGNWNTS